MEWLPLPPVALVNQASPSLTVPNLEMDRRYESSILDQAPGRTFPFTTLDLPGRFGGVWGAGLSPTVGTMGECATALPTREAKVLGIVSQERIKKYIANTRAHVYT